MSEEHSDVVEIDAIGVDEWEHEQHTPRAMDENLAALVKQSSAQSGPVRAPTVDDEWEADGSAAPEPAKSRTTTNTVARPAAPKPKMKTMALPTVAAVPKAIPRVETKAIVSPSKKLAKPTPAPAPANEFGPGFVEVKPRAAMQAAKPPEAKPKSKPTPPPMAAGTGSPKVVRAPTPTPTPTPTPIAKPVDKPAPVAAVAAAPTQWPGSPLVLPAWPPKPAGEFEDWDNPQHATSVGNRNKPARPLSSDFKPEDSVVVDLNAKTATEKPRRPQSYPVLPVIQTSEQSPSASGVFVMPTASRPNATNAAEVVEAPAERLSAPELPPPPIAMSPNWNTPLPQQLPEEPIAAPAAPSWRAIPAPVAHEPTAPVAVVSIRPRVRARGVIIGIAGAAVLAIIAIAAGSHDAKPPVVATAAPSTAKAHPAESPKPMTSTHSPAAAAAVAAVEPVAPTATPAPSSPVKKPVAMRRLSRSKKPVVVDYDKKPESTPLELDQALAQARAAYSIGNQHLFAGEGDEAVAAYRKALTVYPNYAAGYRGLGLAFAQLDNKPAAIDAFKTYVKLAPTAKDVVLIQKRIRNLSVR